MMVTWNVAQWRFYCCVYAKDERAVLKEFCKPDTKLRVLVATTAFWDGHRLF